MKRIIIPALLLLVGISSCKKEDVFALWRDKSNLVIKGEATTIVTVMQYNIWGADKGWNAQRFDRVAAVINSQKPDFVTMNEVDSMTTRNKYFMAKELAERTGRPYCLRRPGRSGWKGPLGGGNAPGSPQSGVEPNLSGKSSESNP